MSRNAVETVMGALVLVVAALFLFFAYTTSQVSSVRGYQVMAKFSSAGGLKNGGDRCGHGGPCAPSALPSEADVNVVEN